MKCPACGVLHVEKKKFCDYCGVRLARRPFWGLLAVFVVVVILFMGSYMFTSRFLSVHKKRFDEPSSRPLTASAPPVRAVRNRIRPIRSIGATPVMARPAAKMEGGFAVAQADDTSAAEAASPRPATPDSHIADLTDSGFKLMRDPLNAEK
jgi:hypothetical protein